MKYLRVNEAVKFAHNAFQALCWIALLLATANTILMVAPSIIVCGITALLIIALVLCFVPLSINCIRTFRYATSFTDAANELDTVIQFPRSPYPHGLVSIPKEITENELRKTLLACFEMLVFYVVRGEEHLSREDGLDESRARYRRFAKIIAKFGVPVGAYGPYFKKARERLAVEASPAS